MKRTFFEIKTNRLKRTFETNFFRHNIVLKFHENPSQNEEVMVILLSVHATIYTCHVNWPCS